MISRPVCGKFSAPTKFRTRRLFPRLVRLQRKGWTRFKRAVRTREQDFLRGDIDERALVQSVQSLLGHVQHANTLHLRQRFFGAMQIIEG